MVRAASIVVPADPIAGKSIRSRVIRDLGAVALLALASLAVGLTINHFSQRPLPVVYQTPEQRFDSELTDLIASPPFKIDPAAVVGLTDFRRAIERKSALILDARPAVFFERGHVPGAVNLAREDFARDYRRLSPVLKTASEKPVIVYCSGGECHDSRMVASGLLSLGFSDVRVFTGGWDEWSAAGLPIAVGSADDRSR